MESAVPEDQLNLLARSHAAGMNNFKLAGLEEVLRSFKILVVDDFEQFRRFVCSTLKPKVEFQVIGEASDGLEAVQKATELQPDVILLDIGLPMLSGVEVAKRVGKLTPAPKILILSQESSPDLVQETLNLGASGYVHKPRALSDLIPAIDAVLQGKTFVSSDLAFNTTAALRGPNRHEILFSSDDQVLLDGIARFTAAALNVGNAVVAVLTGPHRDELLQRLREEGVDIAVAIQQGTYIPLDVNDILSMFMVDDWPDEGRLSMTAGDLIKGAAEGEKGEQRRVVACSECGPTLFAQGKVDAAIHLEHLWDALGASHDVDMLCGYPILDAQEDDPVFKRLCAEHTAVLSR